MSVTKAVSATINPALRAYLPLVQGVVELFAPFVEGAVHDLETGKVVAIYNNFSRRKVDDISPLHELHVPIEKFPDIFEPYYKTNWDGRQLKCTSVTIRNTKAQPIGLICFNFDTNYFTDFQHMITKLVGVKPTAENPIEEYSKNWQAQVTKAIHRYLTAHAITIDRLSRAQKKELVQDLYQHGLFNYRQAAPMVAQKLGVSRATIYNYLKT